MVIGCCLCVFNASIIRLDAKTTCAVRGLDEEDVARLFFVSISNGLHDSYLSFWRMCYDCNSSGQLTVAAIAKRPAGVVVLC